MYYICYLIHVSYLYLKDTKHIFLFTRVAIFLQLQYQKEKDPKFNKLSIKHLRLCIRRNPSSSKKEPNTAKPIYRGPRQYPSHNRGGAARIERAQGAPRQSSGAEATDRFIPAPVLLSRLGLHNVLRAAKAVGSPAIYVTGAARRPLARGAYRCRA